MLCCFAVKRIKTEIKKNWYQNRFGERDKKREIKAIKKREWIERILFIKEADKKLIKQGRPLGLNGYTFYTAKILLLAVCFIMGLRNYDSCLMAVIIGILGFFSLDLFIYINGIIRNNSINNDMLNAVDCLFLQISAGMTLGDALRGIHEVCENKDFKKEMVKLASEYELSGHNIEKAVEEFQKAFDIIEIDLFASALKQQILSGSSQEALGSLSEILREGYLNRLNIKTKIKSLYIIAGVIVIMIDIAALTMFPIFVDVGEGMRRIFE